MDLSDVTVPEALFADGLWVEAPEFGPGVAWRVRSPDLPEYQALYERLISELPIEKRLPMLDQAEAERIQNTCVAKVLLTGWKGWTDKGEPIPFSPETAMRWLTEPTLVRVRRSIRSAINTVEVRGKSADALEGNG